MFGIRISQPGKSVNSKNTLDQNVENDRPFLKAFKQGSVSVNVTGPGTYTVDVTHGLGYYPVYLYFSAPDPANPDRKFFGSFAASSGTHGDIANESFATKDILRFGWLDQSPSPGFFKTYPYAVTFYYYIFYDKLE